MITKSEVSQLADIAEIYLDDSELQELTGSLQRVISFADRINEVPCDCEEFQGFEGISPLCREDEELSSNDREDILLNAKSSDGEYFVLKKGLFR